MDHLYSSPLSPSPSHRQGNRPANCFSHCFGGGDGGAPISAGGDPPPLSPLSKAHGRPKRRRPHRGPTFGVGRRHPGSSGFMYDPLSYALNFDGGPELDGDGEIHDDEFRRRSFTSRLPATPPPALPAGVKDVVCI